jgi:hypothetical protein
LQLYTELVGTHHYKENIMWKIVVGFLVFAAVALYLLSKGGDVDISGEKHGHNSFVVENALNS